MEEEEFSLSGMIADVVNGRFFPGEIFVSEGRIADIRETAQVNKKRYILPGLVDAHIHIESSMLVPCEFARIAVTHGTVATVSDPHEIANVTGLRGVDYMIENGRKTPFYFNFGAPSCVPATSFETSGAELGPKEIEELLSREDIGYLSEMMNYPGVLNGDKQILEKIAIAKRLGKPVDGHAPGLHGELAMKYAAAGISTDHECIELNEALDKIKAGMHIIIREGSAAKNFDALIELIAKYPDKVMFCSDDKHPDALVQGHINALVKKAILYGFNPMNVLRAATLNPVKHYGLKNGLLQVGDPADMILVNDLEDFSVKRTYIKGQLVAQKGQTLLEYHPSEFINHFDRSYINPEDIEVPARANRIKVIEVIDRQLITHQGIVDAKIENEKVVPDVERDILKLVVVNRYNDAPPTVAFVQRFGLKMGALASSIAHDSHNIIAIGADDNSIKRAVNLIIKNKGGISYVFEDEHMVLPLPVAGLMSVENGFEVASLYVDMEQVAKGVMGSWLSSPFMTLSFLALLVIPQLKLSDKGLFDTTKFDFTDLFAD